MADKKTHVFLLKAPRYRGQFPLVIVRERVKGVFFLPCGVEGKNENKLNHERDRS